MLLIGTVEWGSTIESGEFVCPKCGVSKSYKRKIARPFLTVYFIPLLPIGGLREFVICRGCRERFEPAILTAVHNAQVAPVELSAAQTLEDELLRLIALMIVEDDCVTDAEIQMAQRVYQGMLGRQLTRPELESACREVASWHISAAGYLGIIAQGLTYDRKLMAVQAMFAVAGAEGQISPKRLRSLMDAQQQLAIDDTSFQTAIKEASAWVT